MAGTVLINDFPFLQGIFTELNPLELPLFSMLFSKGVTILPQKDYTYTYHSNPDQVNPTLNLKGDFGTTDFGSTGFTNGSNTMNVWDEGFAVSYARMGDQNQSRTLGWQGPSNITREENPMARGMQDAMLRIKGMAEKIFREGKYNSPSNGGSGTWSQRGYRYAPGITNGSAAGAVAGGSSVGSYGTLALEPTLDILQTLWSNKVNGSDQLTFISNATPKRQITNMFRDQFNAGKNGLERTFAGVAITSFLTDFGVVDTILTHTMPADQAYILNLSQMRAVGNAVSGKGFMFDEDLPSTAAGAAKRIYAQFGGDHGVGSCHARIWGIGSAQAALRNTGTLEAV